MFQFETCLMSVYSGGIRTGGGRGSRPRSCADKREALFHKTRRLKSRALPATAIASPSRSLCLNIAAGPGLWRLGPWRRVEETDGGSSSEVKRDKACGGGSGGDGGRGDSGEMPGQRTSKQCLDFGNCGLVSRCRLLRNGFFFFFFWWGGLFSDSPNQT